MDEDLLRHLVTGGQEQCRPEDAMEAEDVLRQQMPHLGPVVLNQVLTVSCIGERAKVVDQRIDPDIGDLVGCPRKRNTPGLAGPTDAEVLEAARNEASRLVVPEVLEHEVGPFVVEREQAILVRGESKEVV